MEAETIKKPEFFVTEAETGKTLFLFEVNDGSSSWVLAYDAQDALMAYVDTICETGTTLDKAREEMGWDEDPTVGQVGPIAAEKYGFEDDDGSKRSMAEQCRRAPTRGVVASQEY